MTNENRLNRNLRIAILMVIASWVIVPTLVILGYGKVPDNAGAFGDIFGIVNALFSSLAFAFLIYTSLMQREELELQREELKLTRSEIAKSALAQETLVRLTSEQLELERLIRRNSIKPELTFYDRRNTFNHTRDLFMIQFNFNVKHHPLKFFSIKLRGNTHNFQENIDWNSSMKDRYHEPKAAVFVILEHIGEFKSELPEGLIMDICFEDLDGGVYRQILTCTKSNVLLSTPGTYNRFEGLLR